MSSLFGCLFGHSAAMELILINVVCRGGGGDDCDDDDEGGRFILSFVVSLFSSDRPTELSMYSSESF